MWVYLWISSKEEFSKNIDPNDQHMADLGYSWSQRMGLEQSTTPMAIYDILNDYMDVVRSLFLTYQSLSFV